MILLFLAAYETHHLCVRVCVCGVGMCMCVRTLCDQSTAVPSIMAGFDDGSILIWESRQPKAELSSLKLFSQPGVLINCCLYRPLHALVCLLLYCPYSDVPCV